MNGFGDLRTLVDLLAWRAANDPHQRAYVFLADGESEDDSVTYAQLDRQARAIAAWLRTIAVPGDRTLLFYPPGIPYVAAFFGCLYAGVIAVPAYPPQPNRRMHRIQGMAADCGATLALAPDATRAMLAPLFDSEPSLAGVRLATPPQGNAGHDDWRPPGIDGDTVAMLQYTSGSTGTPRGVVVGHDNLIENLAAMAAVLEGTRRGAMPPPFQLDPARHCQTVNWLPPYHDMGLIGAILVPLYGGRPAALMSPAAFLQRPVRWLAAISRYRAVHGIAPTFAYDLCARRVTPQQLQGLSLERWDVAMCGAEPIRADSLRRFAATFAPAGFRAAAFTPCYGLAEATLMVSGRRAGRPLVTKTFDDAALRANRVREAPDGPGTRILVGCGPVVPDHRLTIVDPETGGPCPPGEVGEIWVSGPSVARGYWNQAAASTRTFGAQLAGTGDGPHLRTGDLGFLDAGELFVTGRLDDVIIIRGRNHYPHDIEATVEASHSALRPGACVACAVEPSGEPQLAIVAEVERPSGVAVDEVVAAVRRAVAETHDLQAVVIALTRPGSLPKTSSGKLRRRACRDSYLAGALPVVGAWEAGIPVEAAPRPSSFRPARHSAGEVERWLVAQLGRRLGVEPARIDVHEPLARYGLDSKEAVVMSGELAEWLDVPLPASLAYEYPTVHLLARHLAGEPDSAEGEDVPEGSAEPVAIVGIGCRFPGADGVDALWDLLSEGVDAIRDVPPDRWDATALYDPDPRAPGRMNTRWGGFLDRVDRFDPHVFGISPREAVHMDPQQRLLLEVAWEAVEDAGQPLPSLAGTSTGVYIGISSNDYGLSQFAVRDLVDGYAGTGNSPSIAANRLSYQFDLRGPSLAVDTACSSSLVAVHLAVQSLRQGQCRVALAGGVNLILSSAVAVSFAKAGFMAPDGRCKTFDARADGYVRGEGAAMVVLKPLSVALAHSDKVYAVILGGAVNSDGRTNGLTAPSRRAQEEVLRRAYRAAAVAPAKVRYVEAHGTGTPLGDPIEVRALANVLGDGRRDGQPCLIGSIKTNIGHLEAAAGIAGLIKTVLALHHRQIPPSLHFREPNPEIPFAELPVRVAQSPSVWPDGDGPLLAGVSAFGFGGTNAHVVLAEAPRSDPPVGPDPPGEPATHLLAVSAHSPEAVRQMARDYLDMLAPTGGREPVALADLCRTAGYLRGHHDHRLAVVAGGQDAAAAALRAFLDGRSGPGVRSGRRSYPRPPRLAFVFSGQGPQWWGMARSLLDREPVFRTAVTECDTLVGGAAGWSLLAELRADEDASRMHETAVAQPALVAVQVALATLFNSWGIEPDAVVGHSVGEISAAVVSGALALPEAIRVAVLRGRLMQRAAGRGAMVAVALGWDDAQRLVAGADGQLSAAASNGPTASVLSGERVALERVLAGCGEAHRWLPVDYAFHGPQMRPYRAELPALTGGLDPRPPAVTLYSTVTGQRIAGADLTADYWGRQLAEPVLFAPAVGAMLADGHGIFVEIGPDPVLTGATAQCVRASGRPAVVLASLRRGVADDRVALLDTLGALYVAGHRVDWTGVHPGGAHRIRLPRYPWQRERLWAAPAPDAPIDVRNPTSGTLSTHPLLGQETAIAPAAGVRVWHLELDGARLAYLGDHRIDGTAVLPVAAYVEMALAAAGQAFPGQSCALIDVVLERPLVIAAPAVRTIQTVVTRRSDGDLDFQVCSRDGAAGWTVHARARLRKE